MLKYDIADHVANSCNARKEKSPKFHKQLLKKLNRKQQDADSGLSLEANI